MNDLFVQGNPLVNVELPFASNLCSAFPLQIATKAFVVCIRKLALQRKTAFEKSVSTSFLFALEVQIIFAICYFAKAIKFEQTHDASIRLKCLRNRCQPTNYLNSSLIQNLSTFLAAFVGPHMLQ